jgi:hypothetical protein
VSSAGRAGGGAPGWFQIKSGSSAYWESAGSYRSRSDRRYSGRRRAKRTTVTPARAWRVEGMTSTQSS